MGGVIACYLATKHKEVKRLVLAAPAFTHLAAKEEGGILAAIGKSPDVIKEYGTEEFLTRIRKLPITAVSEFFKLVDKYKKTPSSISIPVMILHGTEDKIVPIDSSNDVFFTPYSFFNSSLRCAKSCVYSFPEFSIIYSVSLFSSASIPS